MNNIAWLCNHALSKNEGYKTSSDKITDLLTKNHKLKINKYYTSGSELNNQIFPGLPILKENKPPKTKVLINNVLPDAYYNTAEYNIGFTYWETTKLPSSWVNYMNRMDEVWTTSSWAKDVFIDSGVKTKVSSFSLGIDKKLYKPVKQKRGDVFRFLSIGSPSTRKNTQMAVDAYLKLFGHRTDVQLIYKTIGPPDARFRPGTVHVKPLYQCDRITVIDEDLSDERLSSLYDGIDCVIYPTSGEGWGWFPYQSIAKGIPTICPNGTACSEYAHLSVPLDFEWSSDGMFGLYSGCGEWMKPNFDDLCDKMLDVFNNYEYYADLTYQNAVANHNWMTWEHSIEGFYNRICQILPQ